MDARVLSKLVLPRTLRTGYARSQVDARLASLRTTLETGGEPTADQLRSDFDPERRGYARADVDWLLGALHANGVEDRRGRWLAAVLVRCSVILGIAVLLGAVAGPGALATTLVVFVLAMTPLAGKRRYQSFSLRTWFDPRARARNYVESSLPKWALVGVVALVGTYAHATWSDLYLGRALSAGDLLISAEMAVGIGVGTLVAVVLFRRSSDPSRRQLTRLVEMAGALLPRTAAERRGMWLLSITAGVTEEVLFRGFGIAYVRWLAPGAGDLWVILATSAAFGIVHAYQGPRGVVLTGMLGAAFAWLTIATGSLVPAIFLHALADLRFAFLPASVIDEACEAATGIPWAFTTRGLSVPAR